MTAPIEPVLPKNEPYDTKRILRNTFTGADNSSIDIARILWAAGIIVFFGMSIFQLIKNKVFDPVQWGTGFALVNAGAGAAIKLKEKTDGTAAQQGIEPVVSSVK